MIIGVSKLSDNYKNWLLQLNAEVEIIDLYSLPQAEHESIISRMAGLLLSGGSDIHPARYDREEDISLCINVDPYRDAMESKFINRCLELKIPVLGICRGQQMLNVTRGGTLFADIPEFCQSPLEHSNKEDVFHRVKINEDSQLYRISGVKEGVVNSAHHQALNKLGDGLSVSSYSPDNIIEAIEFTSEDHPFLIAVQWHPERMNIENPLSGKIGEAFMKACSNKAHLSNSSRKPLQSSKNVPLS